MSVISFMTPPYGRGRVARRSAEQVLASSSWLACRSAGTCNGTACAACRGTSPTARAARSRRRLRRAQRRSRPSRDVLLQIDATERLEARMVHRGVPVPRTLQAFGDATQCSSLAAADVVRLAGELEH